MPISDVQRFERAREELSECCLKMFDHLCLGPEGKVRTLPSSVDIRMQIIRADGGRVETSGFIRWPERIYYKTRGRLTGKIGSYQISVTQIPNRRFRPVVDGESLNRLRTQFVEGGLGIPVNRKRSGGNSETLSRAIFRQLADRYNAFDRSVEFKEEYW